MRHYVRVSRSKRIEQDEWKCRQSKVEATERPHDIDRTISFWKETHTDTYISVFQSLLCIIRYIFRADSPRNSSAKFADESLSTAEKYAETGENCLETFISKDSGAYSVY